MPKKVCYLNYKYYGNNSYEDFASGRVIYHKSGMTNYPVRLAGEIFKRCLEYAGKSSGIVLYDPCCGGGYMLTVLGYLNYQIIKQIIGSDVNEESVTFAESNLSLLTQQGLLKRKQQLEQLINDYNRQSHIDALESLDRFMDTVKQRQTGPEIKCFAANALDTNSLRGASFKADIVFADVPYGNLVSWEGGSENALDALLNGIIPVLHNDSVVAVSTDKSQKIRSGKYKRLEKLIVGKRKLEILNFKSADAG